MAMGTAAAALSQGETKPGNDWLVIGASSLGTVFEWYDFYLYGLLASIISAQFFSGVNETTGFIFGLAAFAAGFAVRPFGALVFGRLGDLVGRKHTFLITMGIMGLATSAVGILPSYATAGVTAPVLLLALRLLQGLALGVSTEGRPPMSPNLPRRANAGFPPAGSRPRLPSVCSRRFWWSSARAPISARTPSRFGVGASRS
jgi:MFS family permease